MKKKVVIIGAGFAGIQLARRLDPSLFDVLIIDKLNHHQFQPLFYQVATSQIEPSSISFPIRHIFRKRKNVQVRMTEITGIDTTSKEVISPIGSFTYDYAVVAIGCRTNFFGNHAIASNTLTLKTTYEAITIRNHILRVFEQIVSATDQELEALLNIVVVGGGPTGVELAGSFAELKTHILPGDYPGIDFSRLTIYLVEGSSDTLNTMSEKAKLTSRKDLESLGVQVLTDTLVHNYDGEWIHFADGRSILTKTVIWTAGVTGNTIEGLPDVTKAPGNRLRVNRFNEIVEVNEVYALGDIALMTTPKYPNGHPQVANVAINQAKLLAKNLKALELGRERIEYEYRDLGSMATIGTHKAVVDLPFASFTGFFAWLTWMFLHLMLILSVRNKLIIFINWAWAYLTRNTSLRLILKPPVSDRE